MPRSRVASSSAAWRGLFGHLVDRVDNRVLAGAGGAGLLHGLLDARLPLLRRLLALLEGLLEVGVRGRVLDVVGGLGRAVAAGLERSEALGDELLEVVFLNGRGLCGRGHGRRGGVEEGRPAAVRRTQWAPSPPGPVPHPRPLQGVLMLPRPVRRASSSGGAGGAAPPRRMGNVGRGVPTPRPCRGGRLLFLRPRSPTAPPSCSGAGRPRRRGRRRRGGRGRRP